MTQAQEFVEWAKDRTKYTSDVDELLWDYRDETGRESFEVHREPTGEERRWDREIQRVDSFLDDDSVVVSTYWEPLQYDHADGIYPDPSFYVGRAVQVTVTRYERIGS
jgi:hypothetical protein